LYKKTRVQTSDIRYEYHGNPKEAIQSISVSLSITGSYQMIKRFLFEIENLERFLYAFEIENLERFLYADKIIFENIERGSEKVRLGLSLSVYYAK